MNPLPTPNLNIGLRIAAARAQADLKQEALAERLGFKDRQTLSAIESGKRKVSPEELVAIIEATGKDLDFFADPFRLDGKGSFSFRTTVENPEKIAGFEEDTGRLIALYQKLSPNDHAHRNPTSLCLKISYDSSYDETDEAAEWLIEAWKLGDAPADRMIQAAETHLPNLRVLHVNPPEGISGAAIRLSGMDVILINRNDNPARRNFDFAHELFHILTWDRMPPAPLDIAKPLSETGNKAEKLANKFASRFLMPKTALHHQWEQRDAGQSLAQNLLRTGAFFQTSAQAVYWRLVNDGLIQKSEVDDYRSLPDPPASETPPPPLYSHRYMQRLQEGLNQGRLSVRKAARILGLSVDELSDLFSEHNLKPPFEL